MELCISVCSAHIGDASTVYLNFGEGITDCSYDLILVRVHITSGWVNNGAYKQKTVLM